MRFKNFQSELVRVTTSTGHIFAIEAGSVKNAPDHLVDACLRKGLVPEGSFAQDQKGSTEEFDEIIDLAVGSSDLTDNQKQMQAIGSADNPLVEKQELQNAAKRAASAKKAAATRKRNAEAKKAKVSTTTE